ncbi:MAG: sigma-54-dependent Fis family transcriptional regulator [Nitrospirota bacterium]|nr:MAG: sigma-54-dependent Fis family transcriptional regulator [Nitrospirota bacterium]
MMSEILIVDDEEQQRDILRTILSEEGYEVNVAGSGEEAIEMLNELNPSLVISDLKMPGMSGLDLIDKIMESYSDDPPTILIMTAFGTIDSAVDAIKKGAFDYLSKPLDKEALILKVKQALEREELRRENISLKDVLFDKFRVEGIIGGSPKMIEAIETVKKVAPTNATVLILGNSGTGKELVARSIHYNSPRKSKQFTAINCASIPDNLLESELFGYEPGAFTGAAARKKGLIELTDGGTLFLDEIGDMPVSLQAKLLRVLQDGEVRRVGGKESFRVDIRTVAATHQDLEALISEGRFREDLFYRLKVITIRLPDLNERKEDLEVLTESFIDSANKEYGRRIKGIDKVAIKELGDYSWPGNIRQLRSVIERAVIMCEGEEIGIEDIRGELPKKNISNIGDIEIPEEGINIDDLEQELMKKAMARAGNVASRAAKLLGMSYKTFWYRWNKYGLNEEEN